MVSHRSFGELPGQGDRLQKDWQVQGDLPYAELRAVRSTLDILNAGEPIDAVDFQLSLGDGKVQHQAARVLQHQLFRQTVHRDFLEDAGGPLVAFHAGDANHDGELEGAVVLQVHPKSVPAPDKKVPDPVCLGLFVVLVARSHQDQLVNASHEVGGEVEEEDRLQHLVHGGEDGQDLRAVEVSQQESHVLGYATGFSNGIRLRLARARSSSVRNSRLASVSSVGKRAL